MQPKHYNVLYASVHDVVLNLKIQKQEGKYTTASPKYSWSAKSFLLCEL